MMQQITDGKIYKGKNNTCNKTVGIMGRIKTMLIKRNTEELLEKHGDVFNDKFDHNKKMVGQLTDTQSKKLRNIIAGYVTRQKKKGEDLA